LGQASINLTADTYGKWLPFGNKASVDRLDARFPGKWWQYGSRRGVRETVSLERARAMSGEN